MPATKKKHRDTGCEYKAFKIRFKFNIQYYTLKYDIKIHVTCNLLVFLYLG